MELGLPGNRFGAGVGDSPSRVWFAAFNEAGLCTRRERECDRRLKPPGAFSALGEGFGPPRGMCGTLGQESGAPVERGRSGCALFERGRRVSSDELGHVEEPHQSAEYGAVKNA